MSNSIDPATMQRTILFIGSIIAGLCWAASLIFVRHCIVKARRRKQQPTQPAESKPFEGLATLDVLTEVDNLCCNLNGVVDDFVYGISVQEQRPATVEDARLLFLKVWNDLRINNSSQPQTALTAKLLTLFKKAGDGNLPSRFIK